MFNFFKKKTATVDQFPDIILKLLEKLDSSQEASIGSIKRGLEDMEIDWEFDPYKIDTKIIDALYAYQITCIVGFASQEKLINFEDILTFKKTLLEAIKIKNSQENTKKIETYNKRYLECKGNISCLSKKFYEDIVEIYKVSKDKKTHEVIGMIEDSSIALAYQCQIDTAMCFGDKKLENQLVKRFQEFLFTESYTSRHKK